MVNKVAIGSNDFDTDTVEITEGLLIVNDLEVQGDGYFAGNVAAAAATSASQVINYTQWQQLSSPHKQPVRVASTANLTLSGAQTINGVSCIAGDRVLAKNQNATAENCIWVVQTGAWTRPADFTTGTAFPGSRVLALLGDVNGGYIYINSNSTSIDLGTTGLTWVIDHTITKTLSFTVFIPTSSVTTGDEKLFYHVGPSLNGKNINYVHARVITAGTTGTTDIQITRIRSGTPVDVLSTKLTIDSGETGSDTAATPAVINTSNDDLATNDLLRIDVDAVSTTKPLGLIVSMEAGV